MENTAQHTGIIFFYEEDYFFLIYLFINFYLKNAIENIFLCVLESCTFLL